MLVIPLMGIQIKEEELLKTRHVGEAIRLLQEATHNAYDPEELLRVNHSTVTSK